MGRLRGALARGRTRSPRLAGRGDLRIEGRLPAPECAHAIRATIDEALAAKKTGEERVILFNYSGHGFLDLAAYDDHLHGRLTTTELG